MSPQCICKDIKNPLVILFFQLFLKKEKLVWKIGCKKKLPILLYEGWGVGVIKANDYFSSLSFLPS